MARNSELKKYLLQAVEKFDLSQDNLANLLDVSEEKIQTIYKGDDSDYWLKQHDQGEAEETLFNRLFFLSNEEYFLTAQERMKLIIKTCLIDECKLSPKTLAKYANVDVEVFNTFLENKPVEEKDLTNIYLNLHMLFVLLYTNNKHCRSEKR